MLCVQYNYNKIQFTNHWFESLPFLEVPSLSLNWANYKKKAFKDLKTFGRGEGKEKKLILWILLRSSVYLYLHRFLQRLLKTCLLQTSTKNRRTPFGYKIGFRVNYRMRLTHRKKSGQVGKDPESTGLLLAILKRQRCGEYVPRPVETFRNVLKGVST